MTGVPTLGPMLDGAWRAARRFPLTLVAAAIATGVAIYGLEIGDQEVLERTLITAILGISLFTGLRLFTTRRGGNGLAPWLGDAVGVAMLAVFYALWPRWLEPVRFARTLQLLVVFHLFVAVAPYVTGAERHGFWAYNRTLFVRALEAVIYSHVLWAGVAIALLALEKLFGVDVSRTAYPRLWFVAALFFNTWFFLARIPTDLRALDTPEPYPRALAAFTRFALLPIVAVYLVILTVYFGKVLITWQWPSGWIGWLVSAVAVGGLFSLLLVHPLAFGPGDRWISTYQRGFYALLFPAIAMLWLAIWQRVAQYGVTEPRYFLLILSIWLAGVAAYQLVTHSRGIRFIPASLCVLGLVTFAGPWGAYRVSERSQAHRLAGLLARHGMLVDGHVVRATSNVPEDDRREIGAVLDYLGKTHGFGAIAAWFPDSLRQPGRPLAEVTPSTNSWSHATRLMRAYGLEPVVTRTGATFFRFTANPSSVPLDIAGSDVLLRVDRWEVGTPPPSGWAIRGDADSVTLVVWHDNERVAAFALDTLVRALRTPSFPLGRLEPARLRVVAATSGPTTGLLYLRLVAGTVRGDRIVITQVSGEILLTFGVSR